MAEPQVSIIRLRGKANWSLWKFQVKIVLASKKLMDVVEKDTKPVFTADTNEATRKKEIEEWLGKDNRAKEIIVTRMEEGPMNHLLTCETAYQMWNKLLSVYEQKTDVSVHMLQHKFFNYKYEGDGMSLHVSRLEEIVNQLKQAGENISDQMLMTKVLMSLPDEFKHFISAWESVPLQNQNLNDLVSRLLIEEERMKGERSGTSVSKDENCALVARKASFKKCTICNKVGHLSQKCFKNKNSSEVPACHYCKLPGHFIKNCRLRINKQKEDQGKSQDEANKNKNEKPNVKNAFVSMAMLSDTSLEQNCWYLDSGASDHMTGCQEWFESVTEIDRSVKIGDGSLLQAVGVGDIHVLINVNFKWIPTVLKNVMLVPELKINLFSVGAALEKGYTLVGDSDICKLEKDGKVCAVANRQGKVYVMDMKIDQALANPSMSAKNSLMVWHEKLAHQHISHVKNILKTFDIDYTESKNTFCEKCMAGKHHRLPFSLSFTKTFQPCALVHADVCGPMEQESIGGSKYFLLIKDDFSHYRTVYFLTQKSEVFDKLKQFLVRAENQTDNKVRIIRTDNGGEFVNKDTKKLFEDLGIQHQKTVAYTPEQNGKAEREMRTIVEAARTMLYAANMDKSYWAEAVNTAVFVLNRSGTSSIKGKTPYELWYGHKPDIRNFQIFGSEVYVHISKEMRQKLDAKSKKGLFVGYEDDSKAFRIYYPDELKIVIARDVVFKPVPDMEEGEEKNGTDKNISQKNHEKGFLLSHDDVKDLPETDETTCTIEDQNPEEDDEERIDFVRPEEEVQSEEECEEEIDQSEENNVHCNLRSRRLLRKPEKFRDYETSYFCEVSEDSLTYAEAMGGQDSHFWKKAICQELDSLVENNTWTEVNLPVNKSVIQSKWVFKIKRNENGEPTEYKARLVARGFQQKENFDLSEIYAPVAKLVTLRIALAVANQLNMTIQQMDVKSAFLNGDINEEVYMQKPEGMDANDGRVLKLNKSLYGLKKSPRYWNDKFNIFMINQGFNRSKGDYCLYSKFENGQKLYVILFVDDLIICGTEENQINALKMKLNENFKMKDLGNVSNYLGLHIVQKKEEGIIEIDQKAYLLSILQRFKMSDCKSISTPLDMNFKGLKSKLIDKKWETPCRKLIGCLMYAVIGSRPDLCISVNILSRFQNKPNEELWKNLKRILRFIQGTIDLKLVYKRNSSAPILQGYVDADWAPEHSERKSTSGYVFKVFGATISWNSCKQQTVALSSTEAEYVALSVGISEACWIRNIIKDLHIPLQEATTILEDNQAAIRVAKNPENHRRLKHVDTKYHFIRDKITSGEIDVKYVCTSDQLADGLTKSLGMSALKKMQCSLGLIT